MLRLCVVLILLGLGSVSVRADEVELRSGKTVEGFALRQGAEVLLNEYGCSAPEMTLGVRRLRALDVVAIRPRPLQDHLQRRLDELGLADVARRVDLLREAQGARLKPWVRRIAAEILRVQPKHAEALAALGGGSKWAALQAEQPLLDEVLARDVRVLLRRESGVARRAHAARLETERGYHPGPDVLERMVRSLHADRGLQEDILLRLDADEYPMGRYSLYVPEDLDPLEPRPLLLALHGGGILKEKGEVVRGSARDALALYLEEARRLGWFLVCPTAIEAPWTTPRNAHFLESVLAEVLTLWNVDLERLHLAGQGGGGEGAWFFGAREADRFASISIASAGKPRGASAIVARTALWLYHGDADDVLPVAPVRAAAERLLRRGAEFVYCELPREGHGLAPAARRDMVRFIAPKRRRRARTAWPASSFAVATDKAARETFGDPAAAWGVGFPEEVDGPTLVAILRRGRGEAEIAARRLVDAWSPESARLAPDVRRCVADRECPRAARVWGAWLLGRWRVPEAVDELGDVLRSEKDSRLLRYAVDAVSRIASADSVQDLRWALGDVSKQFRSLPGQRVIYQDFERTCRLGAAVADALGRCAPSGDEIFAELEENLVRHVLLDRRPIDFDGRAGEDPGEPRSELAEALARAYRKLGAERTLFDMLRMAVKDDARALRAVLEAMGKR